MSEADAAFYFFISDPVRPKKQTLTKLTWGNVRQRETGSKGVKADCKRFYESLGAKVYNTSGGGSFKRLANTKGLPDLFVFYKGWAIAHEVKAEGGKQRPEQAEFMDFWKASGNLYICGGVKEATDAINLWTREGW